MHDNTKADICSLPQEIIISLMAFLNPLDLISLRKTCKYFYDTSHLRIVWLHALAIVCARNNLFVPTFEGDLTTEQLFQAATAPSRFSAFVRKRYRRDLELNFQKEEYKPLTFDTYTTIDLKLSDQNYVQKLFVVPGGRFIIVMSLETLQLWDVGVRGGGDSKVATKLVTTSLRLNKHCYCNYHLCVQHTRSGASLRVAVSSSPAWRPDASPSDSVLAVYEIHPSEVDAKFEEIAMIEIDSVTHIIQLVDDKLVALLDGKAVMVWDFVHDLRAERSSRPGQYFHDMFVSVDDVMLTDGRSVTQIKLPKLNQGPTLGSMEFSIMYPGYFGEMKKDVKNIGRLSGWYCGWRDPILDKFSYVGSPEGQDVLLCRYAFTSRRLPEYPARRSPQDGPILLCKQTLETPQDLDSRGQRAMQYRYSEGDLVGSSALKDYLLECVVLSSHDHEKQSGFARVEMKLEHPVCRLMDNFVCPSSGRVYYATDSGKMVIADIPGLY